jgi:cytochrome c oxidase accessory protein FixG
MTPQENSIQPPPLAQSLYAKHKKIQIRTVTGTFANWRWAMVWITQAIFYGLCWVPWNDRQAFLLDIFERKFYIFGLVFWPQDVLYLTLLLIVSAYSLFLFTAIGGRLFCGYACPQTVYTEIFMWLERKIEGERNARIKLDQEPFSLRKLRIRASKHAVWIILSLWTGFTFAGYFTPIKTLAHDLVTWQLGPWQTFWIFFYAFATYGMAGFMREQVCKYMCPYARFQSVMFDPDTLIVTYDAARGEARGQRSKKEDFKAAGKGDCVDCDICVQVCPTGIDIRNGLQYECIGCSACIDGCDQVMDKVGYPRGLIRYSTERAMEQKLGKSEILSHLVRPRILIYGAVLIAIVSAAVYSIAIRSSLKVDVIRDRGILSREVAGGQIENIYNLRIMNTEEQPHRYHIEASGLNGIALENAADVEVGPATMQSIILSVRVPMESGATGSVPIHFHISSLENKSVQVDEKAVFIFP